MIESIVPRIYYGYSVFLPVLCFAARFDRRSRFWLRLGICALFGLLYNIAVGVLHEVYSIEMHSAPEIYTIIVFYLGNVVLASLSCWICYRMNIWGVFFCGTAGYCLQHIWERTVDITVSRLLGISRSVGLSVLLAALLTAGCVVLYRFVIRKMVPHGQNYGDHWGQIVLSLLVVGAIIAYYRFVLVDVSPFLKAHTEADTAELVGNAKTFISALVNLLCVFCLYGELSIYRNSVARGEKALLEHMIEEQREKYESERGSLEQLHIRLHDLKHRYGGNNPDADEEISRLAGEYDAAFHTGNEAIDTVLYVKGAYCASHDIRLRCSVDGALFGFLSSSELYSLFGNALENAIEEVGPLEKEDRWICVSQRKKDGFLCLRFENACPEPVAIRNGMPVGTRSGKEGHGYGMKSMKYIAERHGGHLQAFREEGVFTLDLFFVLAENG